MAEGILSDIAGKILESLGKEALQEVASWRNAKADLEKLDQTVRMIKARLLDAEKRQEADLPDAETVREWLRRLKEVLYRADDLFDEVLTVDKQKQLMMMEGGIKLAKQVRLLLSRSNPVLFRRKMAHEIKSIREEYDAIKSDMIALNFREGEREPQLRLARSVTKRKTSPFVQPDDVVGRIDDKRAIIDMLLAEPVEKSHVSVIPIVGFGGFGKTTLAQLVYNDEKVKDYFDITAWACVPEEGNPIEILGKIFKSFTGQMYRDKSKECLESGIQQSIANKKYLLVLDDIWEERRDYWVELMSLLECGNKGSKILVTTRSYVVAKIVKTIQEPYELGLLKDDESWDLFKRLAFESPQQGTSNPKLVELGKEIVKKCGNVPLAIRVIASSLYSRNEKEWVHFRDVELSKIEKSGHTRIMDVLKLSYDHLPLELKPCFAYCALFPKDRKFYKDTLVLLWAAQGYISVTKQSDSLQDAGDGYFEELVRRNMFQDVTEYDEYSGEVSCKMHDLVHDLATHVAEKEILLVDTSPPQPQSHDKLLRHVNLCDGISYEWEASPSMLHYARQMRSIFVGKEVRNRETMVSSFTCVRALHLDALKCVRVPNSIGRLRHLRYLDLSWGSFHHLPCSITMLCNLQTLILNFCTELKELPTGFWKLADLRLLDVYACQALTDMPAGFGKLTCLEKLGGWFIVGKRNGVDALSDMNLRSKLEIEYRKWRRDSLVEAERANLKGKEGLTELALCLSCKMQTTPTPDDMESLLERLQPPPRLKKLKIEGYKGERVPSWMGEELPSLLPDLVKLDIRNWRRCRCLPLFGLRHLKRLHLENLNGLEYIEIGIGGRHTTDTADESCSDLFDCYFPCLEKLTLIKLPELKGWLSRMEKDDDVDRQHSSLLFPRLSEMDIQNCAKLTTVLLAPRLRRLTAKDIQGKLLNKLLLIATEEAPSSSSSSPTSCLFEVRSLEITQIHGLIHLPIKFSSLESLKIESCPELKSIIAESPISLQILRIIDCRSLHNLAGEQWNFSGLEDLWISGCEEFEWEDMMRDGEDEIEVAKGAIMSNLRSLSLGGMSKVETLPRGLGRLTTLEQLKLCNLDNLKVLPEWIGHLTQLQGLEIEKCPKLASLPDLSSWSSLIQLQELTIKGCPQLTTSLPAFLANLTLTHLHVLIIGDLPQLTSLEDYSLCNLVHLQRLCIGNFPELTSLPDSFGNLTQLRQLFIWDCPKLTSLPHSFCNLTALKQLAILCCPHLTRRCRRPHGKDWPLVRHVPLVYLDSILQR